MRGDRFVVSFCLSTLCALVACSETTGPEHAADPSVATIAAPPPAPVVTSAAPAKPATLPPEPVGKGPKPMSPAECEQLAEAALQQVDQKRAQSARALIQEGIVRCPKDGFFVTALGWVEILVRNFRDAAHILTGVVMAPNPPNFAFRGMTVAYRMLDEAGRQEIRDLGTNESAPIHMPTSRTPYLWIKFLGCKSPGATVKEETHSSFGGRYFSTVHFRCRDGVERILHFDVTADPTIQKLLRADSAKARSDK